MTSPAWNIASSPSSMRTANRPETSTWTWCTGHDSFPMTGARCSDQCQPGCTTPRPMVCDPIRASETVRSGMLSEPIGSSKLLRRIAPIGP